MNRNRYTTLKTDEGVYVFDTYTDTPIGLPDQEHVTYQDVVRRNRASRVRQGILRAVELERDRQDASRRMADLPAAQWLAILAKKLGDSASTLLVQAPRPRELETELTEVAAVAVAWLEDIARMPRPTHDTPSE